MVKKYASEGASVKVAVIPDEMLADIGRLIRAFAEIEDLINWYIFGLAKISEGVGTVMLGRTPLSTKLKIAAYLAKLRGDHFAATHSEIFPPDFFDVLKCRNAGAHGVLLGITEKGGYAFLTSDTREPEGTNVIAEAIMFTPRGIKARAGIAERNVSLLETKLGLSTLREKRRQQGLDPHRKGQRQQNHKP
jgi:hypothetical protein